MNKKQVQFWKSKTLDEMTQGEWESLCDHCGICCIQKIEEEKTGKIKLIGISCQFLNTKNCRCLVYEDRRFANADCVVLSPDTIKQKKWLPDTCACRRIAEGRDLEWWHHLLSLDCNTVHQSGISMCDKVISGKYVHHENVDVNLF